MDVRNKKYKVLVVDDSALMRREIKRILEEDPELEVVAAARNGEEAVKMTKSLQPDVITMDINMPVMDGLTALQYIMLECPCPVVMLSSLTQDGAITTYEALELGAVDFVPKPDGTVSLKIGESAHRITETVKSAVSAKLRGKRAKRMKVDEVAVASPVRFDSGVKDLSGVIVIGQSTGGPNAILEILPLLPADLGLPVFVVQHMPGSFTPSFAQRLSSNCAFPFQEVKNGDLLKAGHGYLAPGDIHCKLTRKSGSSNEVVFQLTRYPMDTAHSPSVDVSMQSALDIFGSQMIGVILTGMGSDGAATMVKVKEAGGRTIAESEETAIVFGMPKETIRLGGAEFVLPVDRIAEKLIELSMVLKSHASAARNATKTNRRLA